MSTNPSTYRRPLPPPLIPFSSAEGRALFREALEAGTLESFFPLIEQFHTQADPAFCGLGSLVMSLNALGIDPGRVWRGPWRWFSEELLDCCTPLERVRQAGLSLDELACLARCNGAEAALSRPSADDALPFRSAIQAAVRSNDMVLIVSYSRSGLGQTGGGHFSPVGGYHPDRDLALLLDVARFKYPPHWVPVAALFSATQELDPATQQPRGWVSLRRHGMPSAMAHFVTCRDGMAVRDTVQRLLSLHATDLQVDPPETLEGLLSGSALALERSGLLERMQFRPPGTAEHAALLDQLRAGLQGLELHQRAAALLGAERVVPVVLWLLGAPEALWQQLAPPLRAQLLALLDVRRVAEPLGRELLLLRSQVEFLLEHARGAGDGAAGTLAPADRAELVDAASG